MRQGLLANESEIVSVTKITIFMSCTSGIPILPSFLSSVSIFVFCFCVGIVGTKLGEVMLFRFAFHRLSIAFVANVTLETGAVSDWAVEE